MPLLSRRGVLKIRLCVHVACQRWGYTLPCFACGHAAEVAPRCHCRRSTVLRVAVQRGGLRVWRSTPAAGAKLFDLEVSREISGHTGPVTSVALDDM